MSTVYRTDSDVFWAARITYNTSDAGAAARIAELRRAWIADCAAEYEQVWSRDRRLAAAVSDLAAADLRALSHAKLLAEVGAGKTVPDDCWGAEMLVVSFLEWLRRRDKHEWDAVRFWQPEELRMQTEAEFRAGGDPTWEDLGWLCRMLENGAAA